METDAGEDREDALGGVVAALARARRLAADLRADLAELTDATAEGPDDEHDAEGATIGFERARVQALLAAVDTDVAALESATRRVASGAAPRCVDCGGAIDPRRLAALPATERCVACAGRRVAGRSPGAVPPAVRDS